MMIENNIFTIVGHSIDQEVKKVPEKVGKSNCLIHSIMMETMPQMKATITNSGEIWKQEMRMEWVSITR